MDFVTGTAIMNSGTKIGTAFRALEQRFSCLGLLLNSGTKAESVLRGLGPRIL